MSPSVYHAFLFLLIHRLSLVQANNLNTVTLEIYEETESDKIVGVLAERANLRTRYPDKVRQFSYAMMRGTGSQFFHLHPEGSSTLRVRQRIDRESLCETEKNCCPSKSHRECKITLHVNANLESITEVSLQVDVKILDMNDNGCTFRKKVQSVSFFENEAQASEMIESPYDPDAEYTVKRGRIRLVGKGNHPFSLRVTELSTLKPLYRLELFHNQPLDREEKSFYQVAVVADDGVDSHACTMQLNISVLDVNDNSPKFERHTYAKNVSEMTGQRGDHLPAMLLQVHATDRDIGVNAHLTYSIETALVGREIGETFALNATNGKLMLLKKLQYEKYRSYTIPIVAKDGGVKARTGSATVSVGVIDVNDKRPKITVHNKDGGTEISVREGTAKRQTVASIRVTDEDSGRNGRVNCSLREPQSSKRSFDFRPMGNKAYQVISERAFDRETTSEVHFSINCSDHGIPPLTTTRQVTVRVIDENDHAPQFVGTTENNVYRITVMEDIDPKRNSDQYKLKVIKATDEDIGLNGLVRYRINRPEDTRARSEYGSQLGTHLVKIGPKDGVLRSYGQLNREDVPRFHLEVVAVDSGTPQLSATATVRVTVKDYNDHHPIFETSQYGSAKSYNMHVLENAKSGEFVGEVVATDGDEGPNAMLSFRLERDGQASSSPFRVVGRHERTEGRYTARIFTTEVIDRESLLFGNSRDINPVYNLVLYATDSGRPPRSSSVAISVHVQDENDETPSFSYPFNNKTMDLSYLEPKDFKLLTVDTRDNDAGENGTVIYSIISGNPHGYFSITPHTGEIHLAQDMPKSAIGLHELRVSARDQGKPPREATTTVYFKIVDRIPVNLKRLQGGSTAVTNLYIIVAIVVGSAVISVVLLTAICIVIRRSRRSYHDDAKRADCPLYPTVERKDSYDASYPSAGYSTGRREVTFSPNTMDTASFRLQYQDLTAENKRGSLASNVDKDSGNGDSLDVNSGVGHRFAHNHLEARAVGGGSPYTACVTPVMRTFSGASPNNHHHHHHTLGASSQLEPYTPLSFDSTSRANTILLEENKPVKKFAIASTAGTLPRRKQSLEASFV